MTEQEITILEILDRNRREMYGLDIVKQSNGKLKRGSIYIQLNRLEKWGLITSRAEDEVDPQVQIVRRLYRITKGGVSALYDAQTQDGTDGLVPSPA